MIIIGNGPPGPIRTADLPLRRRLLYPAELQAGSEGVTIIPCLLRQGKLRLLLLPLRGPAGQHS